MQMCWFWTQWAGVFCSLPSQDDIVRAVPTSALGPRRARPISSDFEFGRPGIVNMEANELKRRLLRKRNGRCWAATSAAGGFFWRFLVSHLDCLRLRMMLCVANCGPRCLRIPVLLPWRVAFFDFHGFFRIFKNATLQGSIFLKSLFFFCFLLP